MDAAIETGTVALIAPYRPDLEGRLAAVGWTVAPDRLATVVIADLRDSADGAALAATRADAAGAAFLAIAAGPAGADVAYREGATHVLIEPGDDDALARMLRLAGRHARRLRRASPRRRSADREAGAAHGEASGADSAAAVFVIALTRFDIVNAAFGRANGDMLLAAARRRIADALADDATIDRQEGATFVVALSATERVADCAAAIERALGQPFAVGGIVVNLAARIGIAERKGDGGTADLPRRAHHALRRTLIAQGPTIAVAASHGVPIEQLAADLHHAIDRREIAILYQPQVALDGGAITGVEALARWDHPALGHLGAATLFAAAEHADLGVPLSEHIQRIALARAAAWPDALARLRVAINVTAGDVARDGFAQSLLDRIDASGMARARVTIEITETGLIAELDRAARLFATVRAAGCRVAIDDFGTGYSSLAYLAALPLDYLKIDRSIAREIVGSERDRVVVRGVIAMARSLGLETIAEGVETEAQRGLLAAEGCTYYQGFLCAEPIDDRALVALMGANDGGC